jgi:polysaccharide export outer membrane protein
VLTSIVIFAGWLCSAAEGGAPLRPTVPDANPVAVGGGAPDQEGERGGGRFGAGHQPTGQVERGESIPSGGDYVLEPTDVIEVQIADAPELSKRFTIGNDGTIPMEYLRTITVGGKTCQEVEKTIADGLRGRYLRDPHVTVTVLQSNSRSYYVQGSVRMPGMYVIAGHPTLMKLITIAGGLAENHGSTAFIIREIAKDQHKPEPVKGPVSGDGPRGESSEGSNETDDRPKYDLMKTNINGLFRGDFSQDMPIKPGDIINIPQSDLFFVAGEVRKPGAFPLKEGTTLQQAVSMAEGTTFKAATAEAVIFRDDERGKRSEIRVDVAAVMRGKREDVPILANDIIVVPNSRTRSALQILLQGFGASAMRLPVP